MRSTWIVAVGIGIAFVSALPQGAPTPVQIGVVDVGRVIQASSTLKKLKEPTDEKVKGWLDELEAIKARFDKLKKERSDLHNPGTPSYDKLGLQLAVLQAEIKSKDAMYSKWSSESDTQVMLDIYDRIDKQVGAVASKRGVDLVMRLRANPAVPAKGRNALRLLQFKGSRDVLYAAERVDLTKAVIQALDGGGS